MSKSRPKTSRTFTWHNPMPDTGKTGIQYTLNTSRAHSHGPKARSKITLPKLKFMGEKEI